MPEIVICCNLYITGKIKAGGDQMKSRFIHYRSWAHGDRNYLHKWKDNGYNQNRHDTVGKSINDPIFCTSFLFPFPLYVFLSFLIFHVTFSSYHKA